MPIPNSILQGLAFDPADMGDVAYSSSCTFYALTKATATDGQETHTFAASTGALANIPCRIAPNILVRPQMQERNTGPLQMEDARFQVNLSKYVTGPTTEWKLMVDGTTYEIVAIEFDGSRLTNRIGVAEIKPFNT